MPVLTPPPSGDAYDLVDEPAPVSVPKVAPPPAPKGHANGNGQGGLSFGLNVDDDAPAVDPKALAAEAKAKAKAELEAKRQAEAEAKAQAKEQAKAAKEAAKTAPVGAAPALKPFRRRRKRAWYDEVPSWGISLGVHTLIVLMLITLSVSVAETKPKAKINSALNTEVASEEPVKVLADPTDQRTDTLTNPSLSGAASSTPSVSATSTVSQQNSMPDVQAPGLNSPLATLPAAPGVDLGNRGMTSGDVTAAVDNIDQALDQLAREILRHLQDHKLLVVWMFDESNSMKDDQQAVKSKFDLIASQIRMGVDEEQKKQQACMHVICGFGGGLHFESEPTDNVDLIGKAIDRLRVDPTGAENTLQAFQGVLRQYGKFIDKDRRLLTVLVTDESGDDGAYIEETMAVARKNVVPVYVVGRQALFGTDILHLNYVDPVTKDVYHPTIHRGPETADFEMLQYDGLHGRWDETPSGFASYELARLTKETGGIYFILPNEEELRRSNKRLERAYSISTLKEYVPDYESRVEYAVKRNKSELRRSMSVLIQASKNWGFDHHLPTDYDKFVPEAKGTMAQCAIRLKQLGEAEAVLKKMAPLRDRETEKRWQAAYDVMLAQVVVYQIKAYEFMNALKFVGDTRPPLKSRPKEGQSVIFDFGHANRKFAPAEQTEKKYVEAEALLKKAMELHPNTPWFDFAKDELDRGLGVTYWEWMRDRRYEERAKLVPKY